jgi:hypothetical protein
MSDHVESFILQNYDCRPTSNFGEYRTTCPFCGNSKRKFYIWFSIYGYRCFHCEEKGSFRKLFKLLHSGVEGLDYESKDVALTNIDERKKPVPLPDDFKPFSKSIQTEIAGSYVSYLVSRGISVNTVYNCGLGYSSRLSYYVIVPIRDLCGRQVYYTTVLTRRDLGKEKTYNPIHTGDYYSKGDVLFNINAVARSNEVWLVEGPMDAMSLMELRLPVVALLGKALSDKQASILKAAQFTTVNVCLDSDAQLHAIKVAEKVKTFCQNVNICQLPSPLDPNDALKNNSLSDCLSRLTPFNSISKLRLKLARKFS